MREKIQNFAQFIDFFRIFLHAIPPPSATLPPPPQEGVWVRRIIKQTDKFEFIDPM